MWRMGWGRGSGRSIRVGGEMGWASSRERERGRQAEAEAEGMGFAVVWGVRCIYADG